MVDIHSANSPAATGTASTPTPPGSTPALTAIQVAIADISQALQNLSRSIQTGATPIAMPGGNNLTLATALGTITITLPQLAAVEQQALLTQLVSFIQTQRPLTLALQPGSPPTQAVLLLPTATPQTTTTQPVTLSIPQPLPVLTLTTGETLPAIVLPTAIPLSQPVESLPPPMPPPFQIPTAPVPTQIIENSSLPQSPSPSLTSVPLSVETLPPIKSFPLPPFATLPQPPAPTAQQITSVLSQPDFETEIAQQPQTPGPTPTVSQTFPPPLVQTPLFSSPPTPPQNSQPVSPLANLLQPGNEVTLRIDAVLPATSPPPTPASNQIVATVSGNGTDGQLILKAGTITLFVKAQIAAPVGTTVLVTVETAKLQPLVTLPQNEAVNFPALPQVLAALTQIDPQALQQVMATRIPQPTAMLPGALLFLFSAFKSGNVRGWLGDDVADTLTQTGKLSVLNSLSRELSEAGQPTQDATVGQWRSYPIPLLSQQQFQALTLYVHGDPQQHKDAQSGGSTGTTNKVRFLIDMRLSKLGAMQIDGFVQPKKLDMILRSETLLPEGLHNELRMSYIKALGAVGYTGALNFQVGRQHWMRMQKPETPGIVT